MIKEIYMRDPSDPLYSPDTLEVNNDVEVLLGQIRMVLYTKPGDVLGAYDFGYNLEDNLFLLNLSGDELQTKILAAIYQYCPDASNYQVDVKIEFFRGTVRDICLIDIYIDNRKLLGVVVT